jgi:hypothetical protein
MKTIKSLLMLALAIFVITINLNSCTKSYHEEPFDSSEIQTNSFTSESKTIIFPDLSALLKCQKYYIDIQLVIE